MFRCRSPACPAAPAGGGSRAGAGSPPRAPWMCLLLIVLSIWRKTKVVLVKVISRIICYFHIQICICVMKCMVCVYQSYMVQGNHQLFMKPPLLQPSEQKGRILHRTFEVTFGLSLRSRIQSDTRILADSGPVHQASVTRCERTQRECKRLIGTNWAFTGKSTTHWARDLNTSSYPTRRQCLVHKARSNDCVV